MIPVTLKVLVFDGRTVAGDTLFVVMGGRTWEHAVPGQRIRTTGRLRPSAPGEPEAGVLAASSQPTVLRDAGPWQQGPSELRRQYTSAAARFGGDAAGLLPGMVTGDTSALKTDLESAMKMVGMTHLTAVSGANCSLVLGALLLTARTLRLPRAAAAVASLAGLGLFVLMVGPDPACCRPRSWAASAWRRSPRAGQCAALACCASPSSACCWCSRSWPQASDSCSRCWPRWVSSSPDARSWAGRPHRFRAGRRPALPYPCPPSSFALRRSCCCNPSSIPMPCPPTWLPPCSWRPSTSGHRSRRPPGGISRSGRSDGRCGTSSQLRWPGFHVSSRPFPAQPCHGRKEPSASPPRPSFPPVPRSGWLIFHPAARPGGAGGTSRIVVVLERRGEPAGLTTPSPTARRARGARRGLVHRPGHGTLRVRKLSSGRKPEWLLPRPNGPGHRRRTCHVARRDAGRRRAGRRPEDYLGPVPWTVSAPWSVRPPPTSK